MAFQTESGIRKYMLTEHNVKFHLSGFHELLSAAVLQCELDKLKYGQANSRTRYRPKATMSRMEVSVECRNHKLNSHKEATRYSTKSGQKKSVQKKAGQRLMPTLNKSYVLMLAFATARNLMLLL